MPTPWSARCSSPGLAVLGVGVGLILVAVGVGAGVVLSGVPGSPTWVGWSVALLGVAVALAGWLQSSLQARLTDDAFVVAFGPLGWPRRRVDLADVRDASAIVVEPMEWGGFGIRWIPWANASAAVLRRGPGISLRLRDGRRFTVTVDDAVNGAKATSAAISPASRN